MVLPCSRLGCIIFASVLQQPGLDHGPDESHWMRTARRASMRWRTSTSPRCRRNAQLKQHTQAWEGSPTGCAPPRARARRRTRPANHPLEWNTQTWQRVRQRRHLGIEGIRSLGSICTRRLSHTSLECAALASKLTRPVAHPSTFTACRRSCAAFTRLAGIFSRSVPQTLQGLKTWLAYSAEVCHEPCRDRRPGQHILQKCATNVSGIGGGQHIQQKSATDAPRMEGLASILGRSVPRTLQASKA